VAADGKPESLNVPKQSLRDATAVISQSSSRGAAERRSAQLVDGLIAGPGSEDVDTASSGKDFEGGIDDASTANKISDSIRVLLRARSSPWIHASRAQRICIEICDGKDAKPSSSFELLSQLDALISACKPTASDPAEPSDIPAAVDGKLADPTSSSSPSAAAASGKENALKSFHPIMELVSKLEDALFGSLQADAPSTSNVSQATASGNTLSDDAMAARPPIPASGGAQTARVQTVFANAFEAEGARRLAAACRTVQDLQESSGSGSFLPENAARIACQACILQAQKDIPRLKSLNQDTC